MPLLFETGPPSMTACDDAGPSTATTSSADLAVVDEQPVAGADVAGQPL
jgi:hypothetical protein